MSITQVPPQSTSPADKPGAATAWWRRPWILPLAAIAAAALVYSWSTYITFDPRIATAALPPEYPLKYPILIAHITFGTIAVTTVVLQVWPWLHRRHPRVHRWIGRVYLVGGVAPSAGLAAVLLPMIAEPPWFAWASRVALEVLWVATTVVGVVAVRRGNVKVHRWLMLCSFALTMDAFSSRLLKVALLPLYPDVIGPTAYMTIVGLGGWLANLVLVLAWLVWTSRRRRPAALDPAV
ncbi:DUF2306 domain-containing protein [Amycolatopsis samaneae]|uniref:DUF2306 domain-containing protein n=1 Tax=Amycolatopsis samaneae TaxID=664691 RepID=A0ABW5GUP9_9PSEU